MSHEQSWPRCLARDQTGQATIEWALILVAFGIPMIYVFATLLALLSSYYQTVTFFQTLPFP